MIVRNSIAKNSKFFSEYNAIKSPESFSLSLSRNPKKKGFHSIMTSMTMFTSNQNLFILKLVKDRIKYSLNLSDLMSKSV